MEKVLSIIVPHYNSADYLERLLKSIPRREEIQIIVVDDNSTERKIDRIEKEYGYVEFYSNPEKENSAGNCRNEGMKYAEGTWVLFADADDYFADGFWDCLVPYFDCDADIVYFKPASIVNETKEMAKRHVFYEKLINDYLSKPEKENELILRYEYVSPCSKLIRKDLIDSNKIRFDGTRYANDVTFSTLTALKANKIEVSPKVIYVITQMEGTLTTTLTEKSYRQRLEVFVKRCQLLKRELPQEEFKMLNINGTSWVYNVLKNKLGTRTLVFCIRYLKKNGIPVVNPQFFRMKYWIGKVKRSCSVS